MADSHSVGLQDGQSRNYRLVEIEVERGKTLVFSFRYFQQLSGTVRLPRGFKPARVQVDVTRNGNPPVRFQQVLSTGTRCNIRQVRSQECSVMWKAEIDERQQT